jgi:putative membrane protein
MQEPPRTYTPGSQHDQSLTLDKFVKKATISGHKEVYLSELALQKSSKDSVKDFARMMIEDHTKANRKLTDLAKDNHVQVPSSAEFAAAVRGAKAGQPGAQGQHSPGTSPAVQPGAASHQTGSTEIPHDELQAIQRLNNLSGEAFDRAYLEEMRKDHEKAIKLFEEAAEKIDNDELQEVAKQTVDPLEKHKEKLDDTASDLQVSR